MIDYLSITNLIKIAEDANLNYITTLIFISGKVWYDLRNMTKVEVQSIPNFATLDAAPGYGPGLLVKSGAILPTQSFGIAKTTKQR